MSPWGPHAFQTHCGTQHRCTTTQGLESTQLEPETC